MYSQDYVIAKIAYSIFFNEKKRGIVPDYLIDDRGCFITQGNKEWYIWHDEIPELFRALHKIESTTSFE